MTCTSSSSLPSRQVAAIGSRTCRICSRGSCGPAAKRSNWVSRTRSHRGRRCTRGDRAEEIVDFTPEDNLADRVARKFGAALAGELAIALRQSSWGFAERAVVVRPQALTWMIPA